ncbi:jg22656 [Pararge aegeria aegeria]|uniref:Jg22656 protein n=1 Tax=Pararge aegeria aegeria TaxID=348720 RepID=A0A8S4R6T9_9NEOP|nr:jg22656 [Pararge aegeria aegeria]
MSGAGAEAGARPGAPRPTPPASLASPRNAALNSRSPGNHQRFSAARARTSPKFGSDVVLARPSCVFEYDF